MSKKLKNQANKMRAALPKAMAVAAIKDIEEEKADPEDVKLVEASPERKEGYDQLIEENDEEKAMKMLDPDYDETLFKDMSEDDPLRIEHRNLLKAK